MVREKGTPSRQVTSDQGRMSWSRKAHVAEALRRKEGPHNGITLSWVAALWDPLRRITVKSEEHVAISTCSLNVLVKVCQGTRYSSYVSNVLRHIFIRFQCAFTRFE